MVNYREIIRLRCLNYSKSQIATSLHCSRNTVAEVCTLAEQKGLLTWPLPDELTDAEIRAILYPGELRSQVARFLTMPICTRNWRNLALHLHCFGVSIASSVKLKKLSPINTPSFAITTKNLYTKPKRPCGSNASPVNFWKWIGQATRLMLQTRSPANTLRPMSLLQHCRAAFTVMRKHFRQWLRRIGSQHTSIPISSSSVQLESSYRTTLKPA